MRRLAYGTLLCPEVSLRNLPRITVRGHPVQGVCFPLRKAPLRSRVCPWSSKRPCGPLAFRRATEGSRVLRKVWGVKREKKTLVVFPLLPPPPGGGNARPAHRQPISPAAASRRNGGTAHPLLRVKAMGVKSPPPAAPLYRRRVSPLLKVKAACFFCHKKFTPLRVENPRRS